MCGYYKPDGTCSYYVHRQTAFGHTIVRQFAHILELGGGYLLPLSDAKGQTIADKIMGTVCLRI